MEKKNLKHDDCRNFAAVDAAKGICRKSNTMIFTDTETCEQLVSIPKCKNCSHFIDENKDRIGTCAGLEKNSWTYGELLAVTCEGYHSNK
ncbi:4-hydroxyphenylacetate decarboxylase small subunit [Anaerosolibacter carboniphilus]|uniref:4-hydroxyphenylacetate decarboxylase small subunit n=1 Tax=Anaerosolibacter carboniphilus TaxID=1417629 RepID=A0A841KYA3_9FIRM|nr:4-hydroxyphenylacetate decarboxylase small subunit [Anaerosolibacter carboniphilus]MBB6215129.1 4-hydroxyphenylacetate decarboxylase small subunit [Anaerosolibacter carboniphilus]